MKKLLLLIMLGLTMQVNAGWFSDNDKAYYLKHIEEAKEKVKECKKEMAIARIDKDKEKFEKLLQDKECESAYKAIREQKRAERKAELALREKERKEKEKKDKIEYDKLFAKYTEEFKNMPYDEFAKLESKLPLALSFGRQYNPKNAKYNAYKAIKDKKLKEAIESLRKEYPNSKLLDYKENVCKNAMYGSPGYFKCDLARKAYEEEKNLEIKEYLSNKDKLKKDFNECYYKIDKLQKASKYQEAQKLRNSYTCYMAAQAATKLKIYGYFHPMR